jgi:hypothetical protein
MIPEKGLFFISNITMKQLSCEKMWVDRKEYTWSHYVICEIQTWSNQKLCAENIILLCGVDKFNLRYNKICAGNKK